MQHHVQLLKKWRKGNRSIETLKERLAARFVGHLREIGLADSSRGRDCGLRVPRLARRACGS